MDTIAPPATAGPGAARAASAEAALRVLCDVSLERVVEMVLTVREGAYEAHASDGHVRFRRLRRGPGFEYEVVSVSGRNPLGDQSVDRFAGAEAEAAARFPHRSANSYPYGYEQVAQFFDAPMAPDLCVVHSAAHNYEDRGGHRGEHGSLDVVQARAPFILAGKGARRLGMVDRACRGVDVAPTLAMLMGLPQGPGTGANGLARPDAFLSRQDGEPLADLIEPGALESAAGRPRHVVVVLLDGANANTIYRAAETGGAPNVARLMAMGTTYRFGAMAGMPTVTLANHTSLMTGAYPGHHHILHNAWWERGTGEVVNTNSPATWPTAMQRLAPGVETLYSAIRRSRPGAFTAAVNEPADTGASYSSLDYFRRGDLPPFPSDPAALPHTTLAHASGFGDYRFNTMIDHMAYEQATSIWDGHYLGVDYPLPDFMWVSFQITDCAFHAGGPRSGVGDAAVADADGRLGGILAAVERAGAFDETAFLLVADHGMEETDPEVQGDWDAALTAAGIDYRDEGHGFIYLDVAP